MYINKMYIIKAPWTGAKAVQIEKSGGDAQQ